MKSESYVWGRVSLAWSEHWTRMAVAGLLAATAVACGNGEDQPSFPGIVSSSSALCAAGGCDSTLTSTTVPKTAAPNEKLIVDITYENSGTLTWNSDIALFSRMNPSRLFGQRLEIISGTVAPNGSYTFQLLFQAPSALGPGTYDYQTYDRTTGQFFGDRLTQTITVQNQTANWDCALVSDTVPSTVAPGASYNVTYTVENNGLLTWPDPEFSLCETDGRFWSGTRCLALGADVAANGTIVLSETITAPTSTGTYSLTRQIFDYSPNPRLGRINDAENCVDLTISVQSASSQPFDAVEDSASRLVPGNLSPGQQSSVTIVMENTGTSSWVADGSFALIPAGSNPLAAPRRTVQNVVATSGTETFTVPITAPSTAGTYDLEVRMNQIGGVGSFGDLVTIPITVVGTTPVYDATEVVASRAVPSSMSPGERQFVTIVMENTGTQTWTAGSAFSLFQTDGRLFGNVNPTVASDTAQNAQATFTFLIEAPGTAGSYNLRRRMNNSGGVGFFGDEVIIPISVSATVTPAFDAAVVSQDMPTRMDPGETRVVEVTMENTGTDTWTGAPFILTSQNTPLSLWSRTSDPLGTCDPVAPNGQCTFSFNITAPSTVGTYDSRWQMTETGGIGAFGDVAETLGIEVTYCGNGVIDAIASPPETCDYGDLVDGDGCSSTCQLEDRTVDLSTTDADLGYLGSNGRRQLATVTSGDIDGDGSTELLLGENGNVDRNGLRNSAGRVVVYESPTFGSSVTTLPTGGVVEILGAEGGDSMASVSLGRIVAADVTGDGTDDLLISAPLADGPGNARVDGGEVYLLTGGAALTSTAAVDMAAPGSFLGAKWEGATAGDFLTVLAAGDLTGDGIADVVLGASGDDTNGSNAGVIYVVTGGAGLTAGTTFDLSTASVHATIRGAAANDTLGQIAEVGDVVGTVSDDLIIGVANYDAAGRSNAGGAFVFEGPITSGTYDVDVDRTLEIRGPEANVKLGADIRVGDVLGTASADLVIGSPQTKIGGLQVGSVDIFEGPITVPGGGVIDLSSTSPDSQIQGVDAGDRTGSAVALGDYDSDGILDIAVGAPLAQGPGNATFRAGEVTVVFGATDLAATVELTTTQSLPPLWIYGDVEYRTGTFPSGLHFHDIDGDGVEDLCVGVSRAGSNGDGEVFCFESQFF